MIFLCIGILMKTADAKVITKSLIDWLDSKYSDKTITTEISVNTSYGTRIADVVVSNGHSVAYEIKSELDSTKRLEAQTKGFSEIFEYVHVVYWADKFTLDELNLPNNVGAIKSYWNNKGEICFKKVKNAKINRLATSFTIANFLWKNELDYFLHKKDIKTKKNYDKAMLVNLFTAHHNKRESIQILRFSIKHRFKKGFLAYLKIKDQVNALKVFVDNKTDLNYISKLEA